MRSWLLAGVLGVLLALPAWGASVKRLDGEVEPIVVRPTGPTVTLDVKDADAPVLLRDMQKQCGIRNLMIDPNVQGKGTFYFHEVPCRQAWSVVLRSLGLDLRTYENSVIAVGARTSR